MTANELWEIKAQVYKDLEESLKSSNNTEEEKNIINNKCIEVVEDFYLKSLLNLMDNY